MSRRPDASDAQRPNEAKSATKRKRGRPALVLDTVTLKLPRCPKCGSVDCPVERTLLREREYLRQQRRCACGKRFETISD